MPDGTVDHQPAPTPTRTPVATEAEAAPTVEALGLEEHGLSQRTLMWRRFRRHKLAIASLVTLVVIGLATLLAGVLSPYEYSEQHLDQILQGPSAKHLLGTDQLGRDELTRLLYGGRLDNAVMRLTDLFLSIPLLVLLIIASRATGGSIRDIVLVLSLALWMFLARIVRGLFLSLREKEFVEAARSIGASNRRIIFRHMLPSFLSHIIATVSLAIPGMILAETALSYLGIGLRTPIVSWGVLLQDTQNLRAITQAPWLFVPGICVVIAVLSLNFLGDGVRDAADPYAK